MGLLQEKHNQSISQRPLFIERQLQDRMGLVSDGQTADGLIEMAKNKLGKVELPMYDQKVLRALTSVRNQILSEYGTCTYSHGARLFLELAYEAATETDEQVKLFEYINLANEIIDRTTVDERGKSGVDPLQTSALSSSLAPVTEAALILFNKTGKGCSQGEKKLLTRATTKVLSIEYLPGNPSLANALLPVMDELLNDKTHLS